MLISKRFTAENAKGAKMMKKWIDYFAVCSARSAVKIWFLLRRDDDPGSL